MNTKSHGWDKCPEYNFINYIKCCEQSAKDPELFRSFKRNKDYQTILEGGEQIVGEMAIANIKTKNKYEFLLQNLNSFKQNDIFGNPILRDYIDIGSISPSTLRYVNTLTDIQELMSDFTPKIITEIGGGYGGLCKIISSVYNFDEYILIDLPEVIELCKVYISKFELLKNKVTFIPCNELNDDIYDIDLCISDSAFAECGLETQTKYLKHIIKNSKYSYVTFNTLHLSESQKDINNFVNHLSHKIIKSFNFDDKIAYTTS